MPEEPLDDPIEDSSDDEDVSPVKKLELKNEELQKRVVKLTGEMRTLAFSKKDLLKEVKEKEREMEGVKEELSRQEGANAKLVKENLELETRLQHQVLQIATQKETLDDWEQGQPAVRLDLERVRTELAAITQDFAWTVDDNGKREQVHQDTQEELRVEKEKRALEREHLEGRIRKLDERVKLEGSAGRERIKELHHEVNRLTEQLSTSVLSCSFTFRRTDETFTSATESITTSDTTRWLRRWRRWRLLIWRKLRGMQPECQQIRGGSRTQKRSKTRLPTRLLGFSLGTLPGKSRCVSVTTSQRLV